MNSPGEVLAEAIADVIAYDWRAERPVRSAAQPHGEVVHAAHERGTRPPQVTTDALAMIDPPTYVRALTGVVVPAGGMIRCPFPDHEDRTPSFRAYPDPELGWYCFGCGRGGSIYDLAAALWGSNTRGDAFIELRQDLARALLRLVAA